MGRRIDIYRYRWSPSGEQTTLKTHKVHQRTGGGDVIRQLPQHHSHTCDFAAGCVVGGRVGLSGEEDEQWERVGSGGMVEAKENRGTCEYFSGEESGHT